MTALKTSYLFWFQKHKIGCLTILPLLVENSLMCSSHVYFFKLIFSIPSLSRSRRADLFLKSSSENILTIIKLPFEWAFIKITYCETYAILYIIMVIKIAHTLQAWKYTIFAFIQIIIEILCLLMSFILTYVDIILAVDEYFCTLFVINLILISNILNLNFIISWYNITVLCN